MALQDYFVWGKGGAKLTPEQIEREREIAAALTKQGADFSPVGHWTQGAARMANALVGNIREGRADRAQQEGIAGANEAFSNANIAQYLTPAAGNAYPAAVAAGASPTSAVATNTQLPVEAGAIRQGLIARGLPEHVADGFVMNFQDESGFNPGINEAKPLVAGSRGGYGLYQLTGPRRREYEAFAQQRGVSPDSVDAQLDFLVGELGGKEAAAAQKIMNTSNAGEAGAAIVNSFLRPAAEHRQSRANKYLNSGGVQVASADLNFMPEQAYAPVAEALNSPQAVAQQQPAQAPDPVAEALLDQNDMALGGALAPQGTAAPQQMQGEFPAAPMMGQPSMLGQQQTVNQPNLQGLIEVINNPFANQSQKAMAQMALQQVMQKNDPMRALEMQKLQAEVNALGQKTAPKPIEVGGVLVDPVTYKPIFDSRENKPTSDIQNYEYARQGGYNGSFDQYQQEVKRAGAQTTNIDMGNIPAGYEAVRDEGGRVTQIRPLPGSPDYQKAKAAEQATYNAGDVKSKTANVVTEDIDRALKIIDESSLPTTGAIGNMISSIGGTASNDLKNLITTVQANAGFDKLQAMRDASPTGGALGAISERELAYLQSTIGSLEQSQSKDQLIYNLRRVRNAYSDIINGPNADNAEADKSGTNGGWQEIGGVKIRKKQ